MSTMEIIHMSVRKGYRVNGVTFDWHEYLGSTIVNRHIEKERGYRNISLRNWAAITKFCDMDEVTRETFRVY